LKSWHDLKDLRRETWH